MSLRNYLDFVVKAARQPLSIDQIPAGPDLRQRSHNLRTITQEELDLGVVTEQQLAALGAPASPDELELFRLCTEMSLDTPELMDWLGLPRTFMADAYHLDMRFVTVEVAADEITTMTGIGVRVTAAALTEANDHVEDVVTAITEDMSLSEAERQTVRLNCSIPGRIRAWELTRRAARQARAERRQARVNTQLQHLSEQVQTEQRLESLRQSPQLPTRKKASRTKSPVRRTRRPKLNS